jgi:hypothetical protein
MKNLSQDAITLGHRMVTLAYGYYSHSAAIEIAFDHEVLAFIESNSRLKENDIGIVPRKTGEGHYFSKSQWLNHDDFNQHIQSEIERLWLSGALIIIGDQLRSHDYFDKSPGMELIRHLRNAVAHNNRFDIKAPDELITRPAHSIESRGYKPESFYEITPDLHNTVLMWEYMKPGDILDVILSTGFYLMEKYS